MGKAMGSLGNLTFVLAIIMFIFAVMGNQLFGKGYEKNSYIFPEKKVPRWNFTDFLHSFMIVFRVLCGEWIESMWDCMQVCGWPCVPFFLSTVIIGNLVVLRLFLALLLSSFGASNLSAPSSDNADTKKLQEAVERFARAQKWIKSHLLKGLKALVKPKNRVADLSRSNPNRNQANNQMIAVLPQGNNLEVVVGNTTDILIENQKRFQHVARNILRSKRFKHSFKLAEKEKEDHFDEKSLSNQSYTTEPVYTLGHKLSDEVKADQLESVSADYDSEYPKDCYPDSYYKRCPCCLRDTAFWRNWKEFRHKCYDLVENKYFESVVIVLILCSSMTLALEDVHLKDRLWLQNLLYYLDKSFTIIFLCEMFLKWIGYGFHHYFTNAWCWLDFIIVMVSVVNLVAELFNAPKVAAFKTMKTLRALRPLRAMSRMQGMRIVVNALVQAIPAIFNVLLVCLILWLIFAIMGVQFFSGKFSYCELYKEKLNASVVENKQQCSKLNYTWSTPDINFDNVLNAYLALLQVATFKGWSLIINNAVDSRPSKYDQPMYESNVAMYFYFISFIVFGSFFTLNLFIGVIIDNFNEQKKRVGGTLEMLMTDEQKKYYNAMKRMGKRKPIKAVPRPRFKLQAMLFDITTNKKFDMFIMVLIMLNMVVMCCESYHAPAKQAAIIEDLNLLFIGLFTIECLLKLFALRWFYFREPWNIFDFIIVILSILGSILKDIVAKFLVSPTLLRVVRVVKIGRILRLVKGARGIRTLLFALAMSLPALFNIGLLLFLVMFIYAIFGMSFFMNVKKKGGIDDTFNFGTFFKSFVVLFPMCTSAGWDSVLEAIMNERECTRGTTEQPGDCGNKGLAVGYLVTYLIITFFVIINMYIAVILENYSQAKDDVQQGLTDDDYDMYYEIWQRYDPSGTQFIRVSQLSDLFNTLDDPLKVPKPNKFQIVMMDIPICEGDKCYCVDILDALTRLFFIKHGIAVDETEKLVRRSHDWEHVSSTLWRQREETCAKVIQSAWRQYKRDPTYFLRLT